MKTYGGNSSAASEVAFSSPGGSGVSVAGVSSSAELVSGAADSSAELVSGAADSSVEFDEVKLVGSGTEEGIFSGSLINC